MQRNPGELVPIGEVVSGLDGPVTAIRDDSPQARHHFTLADQVNQLVSANEADADLGFMARMMALCSLPRTNPGNRHQYKRTNGPYKLVMVAGADNKLPFGNLPRLLIAWLCTEAVRTQNPEIVLGPSLSEFMRKLGIHTQSGGRGGMRTLIRNQMKRLFGCSVTLNYEDERKFQASVNSLHRRATPSSGGTSASPMSRSLWQSKIRTGLRISFNEIIQPPGPDRHEHPERPSSAAPLGLDLYLWLAYRTFALKHSASGSPRGSPVPPVRPTPGQGQR